MPTFIVKKETYYTVEAENQYHADNKVAKLGADAEYAAENPVANFVEKVEIAEVVKH